MRIILDPRKHPAPSLGLTVLQHQVHDHSYRRPATLVQ